MARTKRRTTDNLTTYYGFTVSKTALKNMKKRGGKVDSYFLKNIEKYNKDKLKTTIADGKTYGVPNPYEFLKELASEKEAGNSFKGFGKALQETLKTNLFTTQEQIAANAYKEMIKTTNAQFKKDLRQFIGWKNGYDLEKAGFHWNPKAKRFEKEIYDENGQRAFKWVKATTGESKTGNKYGDKNIEFGIAYENEE